MDQCESFDLEVSEPLPHVWPLPLGSVASKIDDLKDAIGSNLSTSLYLGLLSLGLGTALGGLFIGAT